MCSDERALNIYTAHHDAQESIFAVSQYDHGNAVD